MTDKKDPFNKFDAFDLVNLDAFDEVELPTEDKVIYSQEMARLVQEEVRKEIGKLPIGKVVSNVLEEQLKKQTKIAQALSESFNKTNKLLREEIKKLREDNDQQKNKSNDRYVELRNNLLNARFYQGGPSATRIQEENGSHLGFPNSLKFSNGSITINADGSYSISSGGGGGLTEAQANLLYVKLIGSVMTGDLEFPVTGFIMNDGTNRWRVTINTDGSLQTDIISVTTNGSPMGPPPFLWITYPL